MPNTLLKSRNKKYRTPIVEWVERYINIPSNEGTPGRCRLYPWQREILESFVDDNIYQVDLMIGSQLGKTFLETDLKLYIANVLRYPAFFVMPTALMLNRQRKDKLLPILEASPVPNENIIYTQNGAIHQDGLTYNGGMITFATALSVGSLKNKAAKIIIADEIDDYVGTEDAANPLECNHSKTVS